MSQESHHRFEFQPDLPLEGVQGGTNLLVAGQSASGAREVALRLVTAGVDHDEGLLLVSADVGGRSLLARCESVAPGLDRSRLGIVDCAGADDDEQQRFESPVDPIEGPADLPAIGRQLSILYETLAEADPPGIRIGVFSVSSLLLHAPLQPVSRFVHMLTGRVIATGDLGVFLLDSSAVEASAADTVAGFCDGRIEVRSGDETPYQLRAVDLQDQPTEWQSLDIEPST